jgi:hypothetical protein
MVNLEIERGGHRPSQRLSTPTRTTVASPDAGRLASDVEFSQFCGGCPITMRVTYCGTSGTGDGGRRGAPSVSICG